jgi:hypothetical protein
MRLHSRVGLPAVALAVLFGCGDDLGPRVPAAIAVTPAAPEVPLDGTLQLEAAVVDASGRPIDGHTVSFESSDTTVLTVDESGALSSTGAFGSSLITVESGDLVATVKADVALPPSTLFVRPSSLELDTDDVQGIGFFVTEKNGKLLPAAEVTFRIGDPAIARAEMSAFDANGMWVTGLAIGSTTLTLSSGEHSVEVPITVGRIPGFVRLTPDRLTLSPGGSQQMTAELFDRTGDPLDPSGPFVWASNDEAVVTVSPSGVVTSVGPEGSAMVTATVGSLSGTLRIFVGEPPAGELLARVELAWAHGLALTADGRYFVGGTEALGGGALPDFALPIQIPLTHGQITDVVVNADATRAYLIRGNSSSVVEIDLTTNTQVDGFDINLGNSWSGALSADGSVLTIGTHDGYERFDVATKRSLGATAVGFVQKLTRHPSKPLLYASGGAGVIEFDDRSGEIIRRFPGEAWAHALSPDASRLYTLPFFGSRIGVWDLETGEEEPALDSAFGTDIAVSPDGRFLYLILGSSHIVGNSRLYIVDAATGTVAREVVLGGVTNRIAMAPDGTAIITNEGAVAGELGWVDFVR